MKRHLVVALLLLPLLALTACDGPSQAENQQAGEDLLIHNPKEPAAAPTWLAVCPRAAVEHLVPLARWRQDHGQVARIAVLEDVAEAFAEGQPPADGKPTPEAVRDFVHAVRKAAPPERPLGFLLLVGTADATNADGMFLPAFRTPALYTSRKFASDRVLWGDYLYGVPPEDQLADVAVGRFPARSLEHVKAMVAKTLDFEKNNRPGPWRRRIDLVAGQGFYGPTIDRMLEQLVSQVVGGSVPNFFAVTVSYGNANSAFCYAPSRFREHVADRLNRGPAMLMYVGHAGRASFSSFRWQGRYWEIFDAAAAEKVNNPHHRTLVVSVSCHTGAITDAQPSIGERLATSPTGPALFIGSSGISQPYGNAVLADLVLQDVIKAAPATIGQGMLDVSKDLAEHRVTRLRQMIDLLAATQIGLASLPQQRVDQLTLYNILGDPALSLGIVRTAAELEAPEEAAPGKIIEVRLTGPVKAGTAHFSLTIRRDRMLHPVKPVAEDLPQAEAEQEMVRTHAAANDKTLAEARVPIDDGRAVWKVAIPKEFTPDVLFANVYAEGPEADAAASCPIRVAVPGAPPKDM